MTRDAFIRKWLDSKKPYNDDNRMLMLDDLDKVIARGMTTDNTRLAELEAEGYIWWADLYTDTNGRTDWSYTVMTPYHSLDNPHIIVGNFPTKSEAEAACVAYLLNLKIEQQ